MKMAKRMGADVVLDPKQCDVVAEVKRLTGGGADVSIEALGLQETFENCAALSAAGRHVEQPGRLFGKTSGAVRRVCRRHWRLQDRDDALPRRQRTDAPVDVDGAVEAVRSDAAAHPQFQARSNRRGLRSLRFAARRRP